MVKILNYIVSVIVKTTNSIFKLRTVHRFLHLIYFVPITHPIVLILGRTQYSYDHQVHLELILEGILLVGYPSITDLYSMSPTHPQNTICPLLGAPSI